MRGGGLTMELAEEKAQCHLWAVCVKQVSATTSSSARRRWVSEAKARFCSICLIADLSSTPVLELHTLPQDFPKVLCLRTSSSSLPLPLGCQDLPPTCSGCEGVCASMALCVDEGYSALSQGKAMPCPSFPCQNGSSSLDLREAWVILWKHKTAPYQRSLMAALVPLPGL